MMLGTLYNGMSGLSAHMQKLDVTGNNIANINTTGYKKQAVSFSDLLRQRMATRGLPVLENGTVKPSLGSGTKVSAATRLFEQGLLVSTGRDLDLAIEGNGFFRLSREDGSVFYTRDGSFHTDANGRIVNSQGYLLLDAELPENFSDLSVDDQGNVACLDDTGTVIEIGQIEITVFSNPAGLKEAGENLFLATEFSGEPVTTTSGEENAGIVRQSYLENSNIDLTLEIQFMIEAQRAFELNARSVTTADQLWSVTNNLQK
ncbi:MAG TPA: flagellar basal-body rod protein FlgG [Desulfotomaculum sp.]|nr:flagellar basal-body rod protein FlgG [Desulfotomaculum sp.]